MEGNFGGFPSSVGDDSGDPAPLSDKKFDFVLDNQPIRERDEDGQGWIRVEKCQQGKQVDTFVGAHAQGE